MISGVHASIAVEPGPDEIRRALDRAWTRVGRPGPHGTREVRLDGRPARSLRLRVLSAHSSGRLGTTWPIRLELPEEGPTAHPVIDVELSVEALATGGSRLSVRGRAARDFQGSGTFVPHAVVRLSANACARSLLEQMAAVLEAQPMSVPRPRVEGPAAVRAHPDVRVQRPRRSSGVGRSGRSDDG